MQNHCTYFMTSIHVRSRALSILINIHVGYIVHHYLTEVSNDSTHYSVIKSCFITKNKLLNLRWTPVSITFRFHIAFLVYFATDLSPTPLINRIQTTLTTRYDHPVSVIKVLSWDLYFSLYTLMTYLGSVVSSVC